METPYAQRRQALEKELRKARPPVHVTPVTQDPDVAADWFARFEGAGLDGVVAKPSDLHYLPDKRVMLKVKHQRTADCVVAGFRTHKDGAGVGSLLLGLFDSLGDAAPRRRGLGLQRGAAARAGRRARAVPDGRPDGSPVGGLGRRRRGRAPGGMNRWNAGKDMTWEPLRPEAVCEVSYDHLQEDRFRHATSFVRWRPDRDPGVVHLRPARHAGALSSWRRSSGRPSTA